MISRSGHASLDFLAGGGEMGERIRAFDWSKTPLGKIESWPQSLKTSVSTCLNCAFPIILWWGPDLAVIYNDEYRPMLGTAKHPGALGLPGSKVWSEIWEVIEPMLHGVLNRAEATRSRDLLLHIDREGYPEEAYFSFSYSPIYEEGGKVGGVFCPVIETTEKVIGERRLRTLRDLAATCQGAENEKAVYQSAASVLAANPYDVPFAMIYRLDDVQSSAKLEATAGIERGALAAPPTVAIEGCRDSIWSLNTVAHSGTTTVLTHLRDHFQALPSGAWRTSPHSATVLPVLLPGQTRPRAILVAAISPMRALNDDYRTFFGLIATQIASGLADAQALEEERRRAEALAEIDRAKTAFFSNVSHEFRTPLTLMLGPVDDLLSRNHADLTPAAKSQLELVNRNGLRLLRLVNTLLDFSRIEAGRVQASYQATDLASFTSDLSSVFRAATDRAGLQLIVDCGKISEPVYVDRDMWEKVVLNLLSNAFKFTFEGHIAVTLEEVGRQAVLKISDTGVGIPPEEMPRIFERFHRVSSTRSRTHEGSGIGLALVQELVKLHGGTVRAESVSGKGTTFAVSIPVGIGHLPSDRIAAERTLASTATGAAPFVEEVLRWLPSESVSAPADAMADFAPTAASGLAGDARRPRVIVADDNADMRQYVMRLLSDRYEVEAVPDGAVALAAARARRPDLILSDVMMPNTDGIALLEQVRADEALRRVPIILLSARAGEESRVQGLDGGADDYLVKPFSARELLARIESHLKLARMREEADEQIRQSERTFHDLVERAPFGIYVVNSEFRIVQMNSGSQTGAFRNVRPVLGRDFAEAMHILWPAAVAEQIVEVFRRTLQTGEPYCSRDFMSPRHDVQGVESYEWEVHRIALASGQPAVVCYYYDSTQLRKAQAKIAQLADDLRRRLEEHETLLRALPVGVFVAHDAECRHITMNPAGATMLRLPLEANASKTGPDAGILPFRVLQDGREVPETDLPMQRAARTGKPVVGEEVDIVFNDGTTASLFEHASPLFDESGNVRGCLGVFVELTERKRAEEAARQGRAQFETLLNQAPLGVYLVDADLRIRQVNPTALPVFGNIPNLIGRDLDEVIHILWHKEYADEMVRIFRRTLETGASYATPERIETRLDRGTTEYYEWRADRITLPDGHYGVVCYFRDISVQVHARTALAQAKDELERANQELEKRVQERTAKLRETIGELESYSYSISHDMRAPLRAMQTYAQVLVDELGPQLNDSNRRYLDRITTAANRLDKLITDVLSYSRISRADMHLRPINLDRLLEEITYQYPALQHAEITVAAPLGTVHAADALLTQAIANILTNAVKFVAKGVTPRIRISSEERSTGHRQMVRVCFQDNGIGIAREDQDRIFGIFARVHAEKDYEGTGIGLSVVKRAIERMGGEVGLESELGNGSTFWIELQRAWSTGA